MALVDDDNTRVQSHHDNRASCVLGATECSTRPLVHSRLPLRPYLPLGHGRQGQ